MRDIFTLVGRITMDGYQKVNENLTKLDKKATKVANQLNKFGKKTQRLGKSLTKLSLPLVGAGVAVTKFGADFDQAMTKSTAIMGDLSDAMRNDLEKGAIDASKVTRFSAKEMAEAYYFLASAGLDAVASIKALPAVSKFAQAGAFDLALATDLLTDAQSALGLSSKDAAKNMENMVVVSDVLVKAGTLANATVQQFSESLTNKAGAALRLLKKPIEEGAAVLSVYADQGLKGAEAGSSLNIVLRDLQKAAINNEKAFIDAGVSVFDANGNMQNMADIIEDLEGRFDGMSDKQKRSELMMLGFTDKSVSATSALLGTSDAIREYQKQLEDAGGITNEVAEKQLKNFYDQMGLLKDRIIAVGLVLWKTLRPVLEDSIMPMLDKLIDKIESLNNWFKDLSPEVKEFAVKFAGMMIVVGPSLIIFGKLLTSFKTMITTIKLLNAVLLSNPFFLMAAGLVAVGTAIYKANKIHQDALALDKERLKTSPKIISKNKKLRKTLEDLLEVEKKRASLKPGDWGLVALTKKGKKLRKILKDAGVSTVQTGKSSIENVKIISKLLKDSSNYERDIAKEREEIAKKQLADEKEITDALTEQEKEARKLANAQKKAQKDAEAQADADKWEAQKASDEAYFKGLQLENEKAVAYKSKLLEIEEREEMKAAVDSIHNKETLENTILEIEKKYLRLRGELKAESMTEAQRMEDENLALFNQRLKEKEERENVARNIELNTKREKLSATDEILASSESAFRRQMSLVHQLSQNKLDRLEIDAEAERLAVENSELSEEEKGAKFAEIEEKLAKEKRKIARKQAIAEKAAAMFSISIDIARSMMKAFAQTGPIAGAVFAGISAALGAVQLGIVASKPLPALAKGGLIKKSVGGTEAVIGEGNDDEAILPMRKAIVGLTEGILTGLKDNFIPPVSISKMAGASSSNSSLHLHVATLIADDGGLKKLEQTLKRFRVANEQREGLTE